MGYSIYGFSDYERQRVIARNHNIGFRQIRKSMAFEMERTNHHILRSYSENVIDVNMDDCTMVVWSDFDCSRTTIQHLSKWLNATWYTSYGFLKSCLKDYRDGKTDEFYDSDTGYEITIVPYIEIRY